MAMNRISILLCMALTMSSVSCCSPTADGDPVLSGFEVSVGLSPTDSVDLEKFGILMPESVAKYGDWFAIKRHGGEHTVMLVNPAVGEVVPCFRKGRGPGEVLNLGSVQIYDGRLCVYDISQSRSYALDIAASVRAHSQQLVDEGIYPEIADATLLRPFVLYGYEYGIMMTGLFSDETWYISVKEDGTPNGKVGQVEYEGTEDMTPVGKSAFHLSSSFSVRPDGRKGVCAMSVGGAFSIFDTDTSEISESVRKIYYPPLLSSSKDDRVVSPSYDPANRRGFCGVCSDNTHIYLLYSGKRSGDRTSPSYQCGHLLVYDWDGNPVVHYELAEEINSVCMEGKSIYGVSSHPSGRLYRYDIPG